MASNLGNKNQVPYAGVGLALGAAISFVFGMMLWPNYFFIGAVVGQPSGCSSALALTPTQKGLVPLGPRAPDGARPHRASVTQTNKDGSTIMVPPSLRRLQMCQLVPSTDSNRHAHTGTGPQPAVYAIPPRGQHPDYTTCPTLDQLWPPSSCADWRPLPAL